MKTHELKTDPEVYDAVMSGHKTFEIRKNDRDFQHGDRLILRRTKHTGEQMKYLDSCPLIYTGDCLSVVVTYILKGPVYGLADGWCIMSFYDLRPLDRDGNELHGAIKL